MRSYYTNAAVCLVWLDNTYSIDATSWGKVLDAMEYFNAFYNLNAHSGSHLTPNGYTGGQTCSELIVTGAEAYQLVKKVLVLEKVAWFKRVWTF